MDADVVVIGAGFAGIAAARDLRGAGRRAVVLEARDRIGGRTWYREMPGAGISVEYGGMFFSRSTQPRLAAEIERYGLGVTPMAPPDVVSWVRGAQRTEGRAPVERLLETLQASRLADELAATAKAFASEDRTSLVAQDVTASTWIDQLDADPEAADLLRAFMVSMGGARLDRISVLPLLWDMIELDYGSVLDVFLDVGELFTDGTKSLIDAMADGIDVRFGSVVRRVGHDRDGVRVTLDDGRAVEASAGVVALPLNVWADVVFDPPLAAPKQRVATVRHPGAVSKVLAIVRGAPDSFLGVGWDTPINAGFVTKPAHDGRLFMGFSAQDRVDLAEHGAVARAVNAHLPDATVVTTDGHDWVGDPFSKGTWLATPPGWFGDGTFEALEEPEGRLAFAGSDIAAEGAGWIEGAIGSGIAAAARTDALLSNP
jgi:monoamine oxidase